MEMRLNAGNVSIRRGELESRSLCSYWKVRSTTANVQPKLNNLIDRDEHDDRPAVLASRDARFMWIQIVRSTLRIYLKVQTVKTDEYVNLHGPSWRDRQGLFSTFDQITLTRERKERTEERLIATIAIEVALKWWYFFNVSSVHRRILFLSGRPRAIFNGAKEENIVIYFHQRSFLFISQTENACAGDFFSNFRGFRETRTKTKKKHTFAGFSVNKSTFLCI